MMKMKISEAVEITKGERKSQEATQKSSSSFPNL